MLLKTKSKNGFTLIELMIVVAIILILFALAIPQCAAYKERQANTEESLESINQEKEIVQPSITIDEEINKSEEGEDIEEEEEESEFKLL